MRRVVITGMGAVSPFGRGIDRLIEALAANESGVRRVPELAQVGGIRTGVGALVPDMDAREIPRRFRRSMSKMSIYATLASQEAALQGHVTPLQYGSGQFGLAIGSTIGSPIATNEFYRDFISTASIDSTRSTFFFQIMNHSCASNVAQALGISGRVMAPSAACSTSCQAIGLAYETIAFEKQEMMLCGGADEFHPLTAATFDIMNASSVKYNDRPSKTPRPFDRDRDGVVCAEGCGILLLESLDSARGRGATILGEIAGFSTLSDPKSIVEPDAKSIESCITGVLADARVGADEIGYVNAHATGTIQGDIAECAAIAAVFGKNVPVSSLKGHLGHTLAASGALEIIATIAMMDRGRLIPTLNLDNVDPLCENIRHVTRSETAEVAFALKNNFALGGINSSIILRKYKDD